MKSFLNQVIKTRCEVVVDRENLIDVLEVLEQNRASSNLQIGDLKWNESAKWYIRYSASGKQQSSIETALKKKKFEEILIITNANTFVQVKKLA